MTFSPSNRRLYVGKTGGASPSGGPTIVVVDVETGALVGQVGTFTPASTTPTRPWGGFGLDDANGVLYAAMGNTNLVAVVDTVTLRPLGVFEVAACPWAVTLDTARGVGYVSSNQCIERVQSREGDGRARAVGAAPGERPCGRERRFRGLKCSAA